MPKDSASKPKTPRQIAVTVATWLAIIAAIFLIVLWTIITDGNPRPPANRAKSDMRVLSIALEAYYLDCNAYPPYAIGSQGINRHLKPIHPSYSQPTFRAIESPDYSASASPESPATALSKRHATILTTPLAYLTTIPCIPFRIEKSGQIYFSYYTTGSAYILYCPGYDQRYDIDPIKDFTADTLPTSPSLVLKTYDPTNGLKSAGDIWRTNRGAPR